ncbi:MAG TPA: DUF2723 domain-containing protein [bacterium]|jgi:hypothetical protein
MSRTDVFTFLSTFLISFAVYFSTTAPTIGLVDAGELTTAAYTLSIAHPTGYPLYTLLGHVWLMLGLFSPARGMVVFSVLMAALGVGVLSLLCARLLQSVDGLKDTLRHVFAILLTLGVALSPTVWTSVDFAEVYPLTWLLGALLLYLSYVSLISDDRRALHVPLLICYLWGLGFGNHLTILWFVPLVAFVVLRYVLASAKRVRAAIMCAAHYLLGTSINLYLPIRSARGPILDWSAPHTIPGLVRHLTGWQYRVWMFKGDWSVFFHKFFGYLAAVPGDIGWGIALLALIGLVMILLRKRWWLLSVFGVWLLGNLYNVNYDIPDISTYFLAFYAPLFIIAVSGFVDVVNALKSAFESPRTRIAIAGTLAASVPLISLAASGNSGIQSSNRFAVTLATEVLATLAPNALVFQGNWDIQSPYIYLHNVEHRRSDVVMLDLNLLQRPWYIRQEQRAHPDVFEGVQREIDAFCREVAPFESGKPFNGPRIESAYVGMINAIIGKQTDHRPVYVLDTYQTGHGGVAEKLKMIPGGYFMRITNVPLLEPVINADNIIAGNPDRSDTRVAYLLHLVAASASYQGDYSMRIGDTARVSKTLDICRKLGSDYPQVQDYIKAADTYLTNMRSQGANE